MVMGNAIDINEHMGLLYRFAKTQAGKWHRDWRELIGPAYEGLVRATKGYKPEYAAPFAGYAYRCMTNAVIGAWRMDAGRRPMATLAFDPGSPVSADATETNDAIDFALEALTEQEEMIVKRWSFDDKRGVELAADVGVSPTRIHQIRQGALRKCRRALDGIKPKPIRLVCKPRVSTPVIQPVRIPVIAAEEEREPLIVTAPSYASRIFTHFLGPALAC